MRLDRSRSRQALALAALALLGACGSADNLAGGTVGTETGNALAVQLSLEDGRPAAHASAILRPADAIDSSTVPSWQVHEADASGEIRLLIPPGSWTLESRLGSVTHRLDLEGGRKFPVRDTLKPMRSCSGLLLGAPAGTWLGMPGLARRTPVDSVGRWRFDSIPDGEASLADAQRRWQLPHDSRTELVLADSGKVLHRGRSVTIDGLEMLSRVWVADTLATDSTLFLDAQGHWVPAAVGTAGSGMRPVWLAASALGIRAVGTHSPTNEPSPFPASRGLQLAWIPDLGVGNLARGAAFLALEDPHPATSASEGSILSVPLGLSLGSLEAGALPDTGAFSILLRSRLTSAGLGSLWLLSWTDSTGSERLEIGIGNDRLVVRTTGWDTSIVLPDSYAWGNWALSWDGKALGIGHDGARLLERSGLPVRDRRLWARRRIGLGGLMEFSSILTWNQALDAAKLSGTIGAPP